LSAARYDRSELPRLPIAAAATSQAVVAQQGAPVAVFDGGNGTVGTMLLQGLRQTRPDLVLWPIGLTSAAQATMERTLGDVPAAAVPPDALERAVAILGPSDIVTPGGLGGEVPPELAAAIVASPARKILLPPADPRFRWVAAPDWSSERWIQQAVAEVAGIVDGK
jgi:hypothetical protein